MRAGVAAGPQDPQRPVGDRTQGLGGFRPRPFGPGQSRRSLKRTSIDHLHGSFARRLRFRWTPEGNWVRHRLAPLPRTSPSRAPGPRVRDLVPEGTPSLGGDHGRQDRFRFRKRLTGHGSDTDPDHSFPQAANRPGASISGDNTGYKPVDIFGGRSARERAVRPGCRAARIGRRGNHCVRPGAGRSRRSSWWPRSSAYNATRPSSCRCC